MQRAGSHRQRSLGQELQADSLRQELQPQEQPELQQAPQGQLPEVQVQVHLQVKNILITYYRHQRIFVMDMENHFSIREVQL